MDRYLMTAGVVCALGLAVGANAVADDVILDEFIPIPPDEVEVISVAPAEDYLWVPGNWERDPGKWTWVKGHWDKPPHEKAHWRKGHWKWHEGKWHWYRGHWAVTGDYGWIVDEVIEEERKHIRILTERSSLPE